MGIDKLEYFANKVVADAKAVEKAAAELTAALADLYNSLGELRKLKEDKNG